MAKFKVNGKPVSLSVEGDTPLLWVLRDELNLTGSKFGCGIGRCGACTVHIDGQAQRSCMTPVSTIENRNVVTIEGLAENDELHAVQKAWLELDVPQCGYCQAGQIMSVVDLLKRVPNPSDKDIDELHNNICRCGTYPRIRKAIHRAAELQGGKS